jgi:hypothetical protein
METKRTLQHRLALILLGLMVALAMGGRGPAGPRAVAVNWNSNVVIITPEG